jgi:integrase
MKGSIRQRSEGTWELRVFAGRDPLTGRPRYQPKTIKGGKREAQRERAKLVTGTDQTGPTAAMPMSTVLERWYEHAAPGMSPSTVSVVRVVLNAHLLPHLEGLSLPGLTTARIDALYTQLLDAAGGAASR